MKVFHPLLATGIIAAAITGFKGNSPTQKKMTTSINSASTLNIPLLDTFKVEGERFADLEVLHYKVNDFDKLSLQQKKLVYYLYQAALSGRDIIYDQKYRYNIAIRKTIEDIYNTYKGDKNSGDWKKFDTWAKRVWFSNGIHHHYAQDKMIPDFSFDYFSTLVKNSNQKGLPLNGKSADEFLAFFKPVLFDPNVDMKLVNLDNGVDHVQASANNFYGRDVTQKEVEDFYAGKKSPSDTTPVMYGLNSKLVKENGKLVEKKWMVGGLYGPAVEKIVYWLQKAVPLAENAQQKDALQKLIKFYQTGDLKDFDSYNIAWVKDTASRIDVVNGFIEVYGDAMGMRGSYESVVSLKDMEATKKISAIGSQAQWFEDHSPIDPQYKKKNVKGISAKVITVAVESGDAAPSTPIGINLPNSNWIREHYGSKSVSLGNVIAAYNESAAKSPTVDEFGYDDYVKGIIRKYGALAGDLHTDMHEVIGHASGKIKAGVGTPDQTLKNYANTLEEARADLVGLYYIYDQKLVDMGVMPSLEVGKAQYNNYLINGLLTQLNRIELGKDVQEAHMRNRQLISKWVLEKGKPDNVVELVKQNGKTYVKINNYEKLRDLFGQLLKEIQRIKSEGDYAAATQLVENYGVKVDPELHKEIKARFATLNVAPYKGFIQPILVPVMKGGELSDVKVVYPKNFADEMLMYGKDYSYLPANW
jgi:dipeptidyl-peptidase-3